MLVADGMLAVLCSPQRLCEGFDRLGTGETDRIVEYEKRNAAGAEFARCRLVCVHAVEVVAALE